MRYKIRILFLSASPADKGALRLGDEVRTLDQIISYGQARDNCELIQHHAVRVTDLQRLLLRHRPHIVHFSGHGSLSEEVMLEESSGRRRPVSASAIAQLLSLHRDDVRLVFFDGCFSTAQAKATRGVIDYTIGTSKAISVRESLSFAGSFYSALALGRTVTEAFQLAKTELALNRVPGAYMPVLLIKDGVNPQTPYLALSEDTDEEVARNLRTALRHMISGKANAPNWEHREEANEDIRITRIDDAQYASAADEKRLIRRELLNGGLVIEQTDDGANTDSEPESALSDITLTRPIHLKVSNVNYRWLQDELFPAPPGLPPPLPSLLFVGRQESLSDLKKLLGVGQVSEPPDNVTVLRGWPGVGKTTLVGVLARDPEIAESFPDGVLWTSLGQSPELMSRVGHWGRVLGADDLLRSADLEEATERLGRLLLDKQMLLIVDDVWDVAHGLPFVRAAVKSGCRLLLTTRLTGVADVLANSIYVLPVLAEEDAITLLRYLAPTVVEHHFGECVQLVQDLEGLPLALHVAGRWLRAGAKPDDLIEAIRRDVKLLNAERAPLDRAEEAVVPTLEVLFRQCTDQLDEQTREYFAYLGMFAPKPATFDVEAMKAVWMVEDPKPIIRKLVGEGLLEPAGAGRFQMHALLVQHAQSLLS